MGPSPIEVGDLYVPGPGAVKVFAIGDLSPYPRPVEGAFELIFVKSGL